MKERAFSILLLMGLMGGCGPGVPSPQTPPGPETPEEEPSTQLPTGYGTLVQDQVTLRIQKDQLLIKVTPLDEWVIRLTAPDTYARLRGMAQTHGPRAAMGAPSASLFLVSLYSYSPDVTYEPEDLLLTNRGLRYRPLGIAPITPSWGTQRLGQQEARMAVYAFDGGMDLETDLVVEYQELRNEIWRDQIIPLLQAEEAKVRSRSGG
jgi:hypothetical protein